MGKTLIISTSDFDDSNKYGLQLRANYKRTFDQFNGNGLYSVYAKGCFKDIGLVFLIYHFRGHFYFYVGETEPTMVDTLRVRVNYPDLINYERNPSLFYKYANFLIDTYVNSIQDKDC